MKSIFLKEENSTTSRLFSVISWCDAQSVPVVLVQRVIYQVNKFAVLFKRSVLLQDCRNTSGNDGCWGRLLSVCRSVLNASTLSVILRRERSELSGESRNIKAIFLNAANSTTSRFFSVIFRLVPKILLQQVTNQVNTLAILLKRMYHPGSSANELTLKAKDDYKSVLQLGRSMIEMLGVLAIIGVLSVGGIAGYSKAMEMWKMNKAMKEYAYFIQGILEHIDDFKLSSGTGDRVNVSNYIAAMGAVPSNWKYEYGNLYDSVGNYLYVFSEGQGILMSVHFGVDVKNENNQYVSSGWAPNFCRYLLTNVAKPLSDEIRHSYILIDGKTTVFWGAKLCYGSRKCLRDASLEDINNACNACQKDKNSCHVTFSFN